MDTDSSTEETVKEEVVLSEKDRRFLEFALNENMWKVVLKVCFPLAIFQFVNHVFSILDTMMASHISAEAVSTVAYLSQIRLAVNAIGAGLAVGSGIKISQAYGAKKFELVKTRVNTLVCISFFASLLVILLIPFSKSLLRMAGTHESFIEIGTTYFNVTLLSIAVNFFNCVYIAIERARGNSKRIMFMNTFIIIIKLSLTALFIYRLNYGITMIAVATLISQCSLMLIALKNLSGKHDVFGINLKYISLNRIILEPMLKLSFPVIIEKIAFASGKTIVNMMSGRYGQLTVGALGVSNNICGTAVSFHTGFQDGGAAVISQNIGGGKVERAMDAFKKILIINLCIGVVGGGILLLFLEKFSFIFANSASGVNYEFQEIIIRVCKYEVFGSCVPLGVYGATMALLFGLGYTKLTLVTNFSRVFLFRVPVLWGLQRFTDLGSESVGIVMAVSNFSVSVMALIICYVVIRSKGLSVEKGKLRPES